jgi:hypothetical protein
VTPSRCCGQPLDRLLNVTSEEHLKHSRRSPPQNSTRRVAPPFLTGQKGGRAGVGLDQGGRRADPASFAGRMDKLLEFCNALDALHVRYGVGIARKDAVMVTVVSPGQYVEVEFFRDGSVEIERFLSHGVEEASDAALDELIRAFGS